MTPLRPALVLALACGSLGWPASLAAGQEAQPATQPADDKLAAIERLQTFYADLYGNPENYQTRLGGLVSVISLSRYAGEPLAEKLLTAAKANDPLVAMAAWDALAARAANLGDDAAARWRQAGLDLATGRQRDQVFLAGEIRPLLLALAADPAVGDVRAIGDLVERALRQNDLADDAGRAAIEAAGDLVKARGDVGLARRLVALANRSGPLGERAMVALGRLPDAPDVAGRALDAWAGTLALAPEPRPYDGGSIWFDNPIVITDAADKQFRQEMELPRLQISGVDVAIAIDATGSLTTSNAYIQGYLGVTTQALSVLSDNVRIGVVYYRHEVRPELQAECCREAMAAMRENQPKHFLVDAVPLTGNFDQLLGAMNVDRLPSRNSGHDDRRGALAAGLEGAYDLLQRMSRPEATRVIVLQADADPTRGSEAALATMAGLAADAGVVVSLLIRDPNDAAKLADVADAAGSDPITYRDDLAAAETMTDPYADFAEKPFGQVAAQITSAALPDDYADRGPAIVKIIAGHFAASGDARRASAF